MATSLNDSDGLVGLRERLDRWTWRSADKPILDALDMGIEGATLLAEQVWKRKEFEQLRLLQALSQMEAGDIGIPELEMAARATGRCSRDIRCAGLGGLAERRGEAATLELMEALGNRDRVVQKVALKWLAAVGTGDAWELAIKRFADWVKRPRTTQNNMFPDEVFAVCYLVEHANDDDRQMKLLGTLRTYWDKLPRVTHERIFEFWPDLRNGLHDDPDIAFPDPDVVRAWLRSFPGLFQPLSKRFFEV